MESQLSKIYKNEHVLKILFWPLSPSAMAHTLSMECVSPSINPRLTYFLKKIAFYSINEGNLVDVIADSKESEGWTYLWVRNIEMKCRVFHEGEGSLLMCMRIIFEFLPVTCYSWCCKIAQRQGKTRLREPGQGDL